MLIWAFVSFALMISVLRMLRGLRAAAERRSRQTPLTLSPERRRPSDHYHDDVWLPLCNSIADAATAKLNRTLTAKERRAIWRTRTALTLQSILPELQSAPDTETVAALLASLPPGMSRPDPTNWCDQATPSAA